MDTGFEQNATDRSLRAWLSAGLVNRSVGDGLTFAASATSAAQGKESWILRFRLAGRQREKVLGRYPELSLKDARALARQDRAQVQQGKDVAAAKQLDKAKALETQTVDSLSQAWFERHIRERYKHPEVVERVLKRHIRPVIGKLPIEEIRPTHVDRVLMRIVDGGAVNRRRARVKHRPRGGTPRSSASGDASGTGESNAQVQPTNGGVHQARKA